MYWDNETLHLQTKYDDKVYEDLVHLLATVEKRKEDDARVKLKSLKRARVAEPSNIDEESVGTAVLC